MFWHETKVLLVTIRCSEWHSNMYVLGAAGDSGPVLHYLAPKRVMAEKALWWVHTDGSVWNLYLWYSLVSSHQGKEKCGVFKCSCFSNEHSWVQGEFLNYCCYACKIWIGREKRACYVCWGWSQERCVATGISDSHVRGSDKIKVYGRLSLLGIHTFQFSGQKNRHKAQYVINFYWVFLREISGKAEFRTE